MPQYDYSGLTPAAPQPQDQSAPYDYSGLTAAPQTTAYDYSGLDPGGLGPAIMEAQHALGQPTVGAQPIPQAGQLPQLPAQQPTLSDEMEFALLPDAVRQAQKGMAHGISGGFLYPPKPDDQGFVNTAATLAGAAVPLALTGAATSGMGWIPAAAAMGGVGAAQGGAFELNAERQAGEPLSGARIGAQALSQGVASMLPGAVGGGALTRAISAPIIGALGAAAPAAINQKLKTGSFNLTSPEVLMPAGLGMAMGAGIGGAEALASRYRIPATKINTAAGGAAEAAPKTIKFKTPVTFMGRPMEGLAYGPELTTLHFKDGSTTIVPTKEIMQGVGMEGLKTTTPGAATQAQAAAPPPPAMTQAQLPLEPQASPPLDLPLASPPLSPDDLAAGTRIQPPRPPSEPGMPPAAQTRIPPKFQISEARAEGGGVKIGADVRSLGTILGSSLYKGDIGHIALKELLQNAFDAVRGRAGGRIEIHQSRAPVEAFPGGPELPYVEVTDNGKGMTRDELETVFTNLGASGKRENVEASGGFGLAKAAPLLGGEYVKVRSVVAEPGQGLRVHTFEGTPEDLLNGVPIQTSLAGPNDVTGVTVRTFTKDDSGYGQGMSFATNVAEHSLGDMPAIDLHYTRLGEKKRVVMPARLWGSNATPIKVLDSPTETIEIYQHPTTKFGEGGTVYKISNNGLWQLDSQYGWGLPIPNTPDRLAVNIKSKVPEGDRAYPFVGNREDIKSSVKAKIDAFVKQEFIDPALGTQRQNIIEAFNNIPTVRIKGRDIPIYDVGRRFTPEELATITADPHFQDLAHAALTSLDDILTILPNGGQVVKRGIIFDAKETGHDAYKLYGIHIPNPAAPGGSNESAILLNIIEAMRDANNPDQAASKIHHTIYHEAAHVDVPHHNEEFTQRLARLYREAGSGIQIRTLKRILHAYGGTAADPGQYHAGLSKTLQNYIESRGRGASVEDPLRRTGVDESGHEALGAGQSGYERGPGPGPNDAEIPVTAPPPADFAVHSIEDLQRIASGEGTVPLYHGTTATRAGQILRNGVQLAASGEAAAREVMNLYDIPWMEWKKIGYEDFGYGQQTRRLSTSALGVADRWANPEAFPQGEILTQLNNKARILVEAKRRGISFQDLYDSVPQGVKMGREADYLGLPDKMAGPGPGGVVLAGDVDARAIDQHHRRDAQDYLNAIQRGNLTPEQAIGMWNHTYKDVKIAPQNWENARVVKGKVEDETGAFRLGHLIPTTGALVGGAIGGASDDEHPIRGAVMGGLAGLAGATMGAAALRRPSALTTRLTEIDRAFPAVAERFKPNRLSRTTRLTGHLANAYTATRDLIGTSFTPNYALLRLGTAFKPAVKAFEDFKAFRAELPRHVVGTLKSIIEPLKGPDEMALFFRTLRLRRDIAASAEGTKVIESDLPLGDATAALREYERILQDHPTVRQALENHKATMRHIGNQLIADGQIRPETIDANSEYFTDYVLNKIAPQVNISGQPIPPIGRANLPGYLRQRKGGARETIRDYTTVVAKYLGQTTYDQSKRNFVRDLVMNYDPRQPDRATLVRRDMAPEFGQPDATIPSDYKEFHYGPRGKQQSYFLPKAIVDELQRTTSQTPQLLKVYGNLHRPMKGYLLKASGGTYYINNWLGDHVNLYASTPMHEWWKLPGEEAQAAMGTYLLRRDPSTTFGQRMKSLAQRGEAAGIGTAAASADITEQSLRDPMLRRLSADPGASAPARAAESFGGLWTTATAAVNDTREFLENIPRLTRFIHEINQGTMDIPAGRIANRSLVDYNHLTPFEERYLRGLGAPFWTWAANNLSNWVPGVKGVGFKDKLSQSPKALGRILRTVPFAFAAQAWNETMFPEAEHSLSEYERRQFHLLLPFAVDENGISSLKYLGFTDPAKNLKPGEKPIWAGFQGPGNIAGKMLGVGGIASRGMDLALGYTTPKEQLAESGRQIRQSWGQLANPAISAAYEIGTNTDLQTGATVAPEVLPWARQNWLPQILKDVAPNFAAQLDKIPNPLAGRTKTSTLLQHTLGSLPPFATGQRAVRENQGPEGDSWAGFAKRMIVGTFIHSVDVEGNMEKRLMSAVAQAEQDARLNRAQDRDEAIHQNAPFALLQSAKGMSVLPTVTSMREAGPEKALALYFLAANAPRDEGKAWAAAVPDIAKELAQEDKRWESTRYISQLMQQHPAFFAADELGANLQRTLNQPKKSFAEKIPESLRQFLQP